MFDLDETIRLRKSTRMFLPDPVPKHILNEALALAMWAPSNSNVQPWQVFLTSGAVRDRLVAAMLAEARAKPPNVPELPASHTHLRTNLGAVVYGAMGISRHDKEARRNAVLRNWEFFRAPIGGIVCMHRDLGLVDSMGVGMFLQTLLLALTARGLGTCVQVSIAGYPDVVRKQLSIPEELLILCGLAIGYPDIDFAGNNTKVGRDSVDKHVTFLNG